MKRRSIKRDPVKGRGVYADEFIKKGDVIEVCELLLIPYAEAIESLDAYVFGFDKSHLALALGNGSLYNHTNRPNAFCYFDFKKKQIVFEAKRNIHPEEEIFINYGYSEADKKKYGIV